MEKIIPVGVSARHVHLSQGDLETLFGEGYKLTPKKDLSQPGQFAAEETVEVVGSKRSFPTVRILGPVRRQTQVELSVTDCFTIGVKAPVRESGDIKDSGSVTLVGPKGQITLSEGVIVAGRHIHMHPDDARKFGVIDKQRVNVKTEGERSLIMENVIIRVRDDFSLELHIDTDEANAAGLGNGSKVRIID
ncbi:MAG: phosphate propanoyltransferase [Firmicutes bacterium]|nr:phosphate propanoyltransferase [Bacillota bacterium]MDD4264394.1 phosphate propanoyltransferase [Bacillota bacterium]MDD4693681.1 phosphate propanoyltransferase [Bacillota bacterium]